MRIRIRIQESQEYTDPTVSGFATLRGKSQSQRSSEICCTIRLHEIYVCGQVKVCKIRAWRLVHWGPAQHSGGGQQEAAVAAEEAVVQDLQPTDLSFFPASVTDNTIYGSETGLKFELRNTGTGISTYR